MFGVALDNRLIRKFIQYSMSKRPNSAIVDVPLSDDQTMGTLALQSMYYDYMLLQVSVSEEDKLQNIPEVIEMARDAKLHIVFLSSSPKVIKKLNGSVNIQGEKLRDVSLHSINSEIIMKLLYDMYYEANHKKIPIGVLKKLVRRVRSTTKVDNLLDEILSKTTLTALKELVTYRKEVYSGVFAPTLILGEDKGMVCAYIQKNFSSLTYIFTILVNFVSDTLEVYPQYLKGDFCQATLSKYETGKERGKFNKYGTDPSLYLRVCERKSYEYLYTLNERISEAKTRSQRILILGELLL